MPDARSTTPALPRPRLRVVPAPVGDPPFDDELQLNRQAGSVTAPVQNLAGDPQLPLTFVLPSGLPVEPEPVALTVLPAARQPYRGCDADDDGPTFTSRSQLPDPTLWSGRLAQAVVEVCSGGRPVGQLLRWTSPEVFRTLSERYPPRSARGMSGRTSPVVRPLPRHRFDQVRSVHVCEPADGVAEVSVVVASNKRWWALALRLEGLNGRWVATRLELL
jgi:hypothetical protein